MNFVHPEMLYLAPLVTLPIIIHLLNRVRYRRVRWAAIDFLLTTEQRAVRRAKVRQWLLMAVRMLLLAAVLMALAQPIFGGGLAALLGSSGQIAIVVDNSPSMSAVDVGGSSFERAKEMVDNAIENVPAATRLLLGSASGHYESSFREPLQAHDTVLQSLEEVRLKAGLDDMAGSIKAAAEALERGGGGGMIWLVTDSRAAGWLSSGEGAWQAAREALEKAGRPRLIVSSLLPVSLNVNRRIERIRVEPEILLEGDVPRLTASVGCHGTGGAVSVRLYCEDRLVDSRTAQVADNGTTDVVFQLPAVRQEAQWGYVELEKDGMPQDDRHYFLIRPSESLPVLIVDSRPESGRFSRDGDFLELALCPPETQSARSPFKVTRVEASKLGEETLTQYQGVILSEASRLDPAQAVRLSEYVRNGGWLMIFPGKGTDAESFNSMRLTPTVLGPKQQAPQGGLWRIAYVAQSPVVNWLVEAGLEMMLVEQSFDLQPAESDEVMLALNNTRPMLVRSQLGKGRVYTWSVSSGTDFSRLPVWMMLPIVHASLLEHVVETGASLSVPAFRRLDLPGQLRLARIVTARSEILPLAFPDDDPSGSYFAQTEQAGIYRLAASEQPADIESARAIAAVNVPAEESSLETIDAAGIRDCIGAGYPLIYLEGDQDLMALQAEKPSTSAASGFPLAALGLALLLAEALMAWSLSRPSRTATGSTGDVRKPGERG